MANCDQGCSCIVRVGDGLAIKGSGSPTNPYVISLEDSLQGGLIVQDTETVNMSLYGSGIPSDPYVISATSSIKLTQLADVSDPQGAPNAGDVPVWVTTGAVGHWEFQPPPANPPGAVNVSTGIAGDGSAGAPIRVRLIGTSAGGTTSGLEVYADSAGNLRAVPPVASTVTWSSITGKPTSFPTTPADFTGTLPSSKGGTGQTDLGMVTVGNSSRIGGYKIFIQSGTPTGMGLNDLWFW